MKMHKSKSPPITKFMLLSSTDNSWGWFECLWGREFPRIQIIEFCFFPGSWKCRKVPVQPGTLKHSLILVAILISSLVSLSYIINAHVLRNAMKLMFVQVQAIKSTPKVQKHTYQKVDASSQGVDASSPGVLQHKHKYLRREGKTGSKSSNCSS